MSNTLKTLGSFALVGALLSGCALVNENIALGDGKEAAEAAMRLEDPQSLERVSIDGRNLKARIIAVGKLNDLSSLCRFVKDARQPGELRLAAFQRIVALGKAEAVLKGKTDSKGESDDLDSLLNKIVDSELNEIIVFGKRCSDKNAPLAFPEEWRIKAMQYDDSVFQHSREANSEFLLDQSMPMSVRKAAIGKIELEAKGVAQLLNAAADEQNPGHADYRVLVEGFLVSKQCHEGIPGSIIAEHGNVGVPVSIGAKKLLFSFIKNEKALADTLKSALWAAIEDEENGSKDSEKIQFFKWAFATAKNPKVIAEIIRIPGTSKEKILQDLIYMANCIDDDTVLADLLAKDSDLKSRNVYSPLVEAIVSRIKDPQIKKDAGTLALAYNAVDPKKRAKALVEVYAKSPEKAYGVAMEWFSTEHYDGNVKGSAIAGEVRDLATLAGLVAICKKDLASRSYTSEINLLKSVLRGLNGGIMNTLLECVNGLPKEKLDKLAAAMKARSEKMDKEGKTCVIGNYFVGMPLGGFIALNKTQDIKAFPLDWEMDPKTRHIVMSKFGFDSKNLYKATGVEKSNVFLTLPEKIGVAKFEKGRTKVEVERRDDLQAQLSEGFGDFSNSFNVSGGDIYYRSETQAKGVVLLYWKESGELVLESLK